MSLDEYNKKRDFNKTTEPKGTLGLATGVLQFVVLPLS
jgi:bifunctional non-homologous end joining protein LigD